MVNEALQGTSLASDPPVHTQLRATLTENLTPRALRGLKVTIDEKADALVAELVERACFEAIDALARAFPLEVVADLIGFTGHVARQHAALGPGRDAGHRSDEPAHRRELPDRRRALRLVLPGHRRGPRARLGRPRDLRRRDARRHPRRARPGTSSTSTSAPASTPRSRRSATSSRCSPPTPTSSTSSARTPHWCRRVQRGAALLGPGPRLGPPGDPRRRDRRRHRSRRRPGRDPVRRRQPRPAALRRTPTRSDVERNPVDHLSFGYGPHGCAGQGLARLEAHAIIEALARRVKRLSVGDEVRVPSNITRSIEELQVLEVVAA